MYRCSLDVCYLNCIDNDHIYVNITSKMVKSLWKYILKFLSQLTAQDTQKTLKWKMGKFNYTAAQ